MNKHLQPFIFLALRYIAASCRKWEGNDNFHSLNEFTGFWSSSERDVEYIFGFGLPPIQELEGQLAHKQAGLSVRCIKDQ